MSRVYCGECIVRVVGEGMEGVLRECVVAEGMV